MTSPIIFDVNENDYEYEVIAFSHNTPMVVEFWAEWSKACHQMQPLLNDLALAANGLFRLARVEIDKNPGLPQRYSIRTIPTLIVVSNGQMTAELIGEQPEFRLKEFLNHITPANPFKLLAERASVLLGNRDWSAAEKQFRIIIDQDPGFSTAQLGLALSILPQGGHDYFENDTCQPRIYPSREDHSVGLCHPTISNFARRESPRVGNCLYK
jgi:putative thioredoxin